jgi:hypothetical protein
MKTLFTFFTWALLVGLAGLSVRPSDAQTRALRIATQNIEADINNVTAPLPGLIAPPGGTIAQGGVVEGLGEENLGGDPAQPVDILALQETTSNPITVAPIVNGLNTFYNTPGLYTNSTYQATESGGDVADGNGPNAIVFNTKTVQLLASVPVDPPGGTGKLGSTYGEYREVMRYEFAPAGVAPAASNEFYIYVSHYKSGTSSADLTDRTGEAQIIRNDETSLPATARVLYVGDYNISASSETSYTDMLTPKAPNGIAQGQGVDPFNVSGSTSINWAASTTSAALLMTMTEHSYDLEYRDDFQIMTTNVYYGYPGGLQYVSGTYHTFGNNGTTPYYGSVNSGSDTAFQTNLVKGAAISAAQLYLDLTNASDHLPVVADYTIPLPTANLTGASGLGTNLLLTAVNGVTGGVYIVFMSPNLLAPPANWTAISTNVAGGASFTLTVMNAFSRSRSAQFFRLQTP